MPVSIVARHLAREFLTATLGVLAALILVWVAADVLLHVEDFQSGAWNALRSALLRSFELLPQGVPTACGIGAVFSMSRATRSLEITAIRCGGIPLRRALLPILIVCTLIAVALGFFHDRVLIPTNLMLSGAEEPERDERPQKVGDRWWYVSNSWLFSASDFDARERKLIDVTVFRFGDANEIIRRLDAGSAVYVDAGQWRFFDVLDQNFSEDGIRDIRRFDKLALNLGVDLTSAVLRDAAGAVVPDIMTLHGLSDAADEATNPAEIRTLRSTYHARLALPLSVLILVLLVLPEGLRGNDRDDASLPKALLTSVAAMAAFWAFWVLARIGSQGAWFPSPAIPIWGAASLALLWGFWRFRGIKE